jgi:hypothetical protein
VKTGWPTPRVLASPLAWTAVSAAIFAAYFRSVWSPPQLWAEDALVFLAEALTHPLAAIVEPYSGYLLVLPRLLALSALAVPLAWVPFVYAALAFACTIAAMAYAATARMPVPHWQLAPLALALVPHNGEIAFTITNVQWIAATSLALVAVAPPAESRARRYLDLSVVALTGLTGPFSILFLPAFVLQKLAFRESRQASALLAVAAATALVQVASFVASGAPSHVPSVWPGLDVLLQVLIANGLGEWFGFDPRPRLPWGFVVLAGLVLAIAGPLLSPASRRMILALGLCAGAVLGAAIVKWSGDMITLPRFAPYGLGSRYFFLSGVLLAWMLLIAAWDARRPSRYAALLALALFVANGIWHTKRVPRPDQDWAGQVRRFEAGEISALRILPEGWTVILPRPQR